MVGMSACRRVYKASKGNTSEDRERKDHTDYKARMLI